MKLLRGLAQILDRDLGSYSRRLVTAGQQVFKRMAGLVHGANGGDYIWPNTQRHAGLVWPMPAHARTPIPQRRMHS